MKAFAFGVVVGALAWALVFWLAARRQSMPRELNLVDLAAYRYGYRRRRAR